eukprot:1835392-Alexandrium_andersonii.AAC.1
MEARRSTTGYSRPDSRYWARGQGDAVHVLWAWVWRRRLKSVRSKDPVTGRPNAALAVCCSRSGVGPGRRQIRRPRGT